EDRAAGVGEDRITAVVGDRRPVHGRSERWQAGGPPRTEHRWRVRAERVERPRHAESTPEAGDGRVSGRVGQVARLEADGRRPDLRGAEVVACAGDVQGHGYG